MKKLLLTMLTASFMLAAPCLNAGLGGKFPPYDALITDPSYAAPDAELLVPSTTNSGLPPSDNFKFDTRISARAGTPAEQITENIPEYQRADREYSDEFYKMKEARANDTRLARLPVKFIKIGHSSSDGIAANFFGPDFSVVGINQNRIEQTNTDLDIAWNTFVLAHELGHVIKAHTGAYDIKRKEREADIEGYKTLAHCGYYKTINTMRNDTILKGIECFKTLRLPVLYSVLRALDLPLLSNAPGFIKAHCVISALSWMWSTSNRLYQLYYPRGPYYPNLYQQFMYQTQALNECRKDVDPKDTQDSKHLMRNGSAV